MSKYVKFGIKSLLTIVFVWLLVSKIDIYQSMKIALDLPVYKVIFAFILYYVASISINSLIVLEIAHAKLRNIIQFDKVNIAMRACSLIMPLLIVSALRWKIYRNMGIGKRNSLSIMLVNRFHQILTSSLFVLIVAPVLLSSYMWKYTVLMLVAGCLFLMSFVVVLYGINYKSLGDRLLALSSKVKIIKNRFGGGFSLCRISNTRRLIFLLIASVLGSLIIITSQYIVASSFFDVEFFHMVLARSIVQILLVLPITIGGLGVREIGFASVLSLFGYDGESVIAFTLVLLSFQVFLFVLGLVVYFFDRDTFHIQRARQEVI